jgi:hypothetical protein
MTTTNPALNPNPATDPAPTAAEAILQTYQEIKDALPKAEIPLYDSPDEWSTFYRSTGFLTFLKGKDPEILQSLLGVGGYPRRQDDLNGGFLKISLLYISELGETQVGGLPEAVRADLRTYSDEKNQMKPLRILQNQRTITNYCVVLEYFFIFLLSTWQLQVRPPHSFDLLFFYMILATRFIY